MQTLDPSLLYNRALQTWLETHLKPELSLAATAEAQGTAQSFHGLSYSLLRTQCRGL